MTPSHLRKGQVATEFMLYTAVFMFVAVAAFIVVNDFQSSEVPLQQNSVAKETGDGFVSVLTLNVKGGEGFAYKYTFPKSLFNLPYSVDFRNINNPNATILLTWSGNYGNFSYLYSVPKYNYVINGPCLNSVSNPGTLISTNCTNELLFYNDGENLTITQMP